MTAGVFVHTDVRDAVHKGLELRGDNERGEGIDGMALDQLDRVDLGQSLRPRVLRPHVHLLRRNIAEHEV
jgi:hypothetical protein